MRSVRSCAGRTMGLALIVFLIATPLAQGAVDERVLLDISFEDEPLFTWSTASASQPDQSIIQLPVTHGISTVGVNGSLAKWTNVDSTGAPSYPTSEGDQTSWLMTIGVMVQPNSDLLATPPTSLSITDYAFSSDISLDGVAMGQAQVALILELGFEARSGDPPTTESAFLRLHTPIFTLGDTGAGYITRDWNFNDLTLGLQTDTWADVQHVLESGGMLESFAVTLISWDGFVEPWSLNWGLDNHNTMRLDNIRLVQHVPEPSGLALAGLAAAGLLRRCPPRRGKTDRFDNDRRPAL